MLSQTGRVLTSGYQVCAHVSQNGRLDLRPIVGDEHRVHVSGEYICGGCMCKMPAGYVGGAISQLHSKCSWPKTSLQPPLLNLIFI